HRIAEVAPRRGARVEQADDGRRARRQDRIGGPRREDAVGRLGEGDLLPAGGVGRDDDRLLRRRLRSDGHLVRRAGEKRQGEREGCKERSAHGGLLCGGVEGVLAEFHRGYHGGPPSCPARSAVAVEPYAGLLLILRESSLASRLLNVIVDFLPLCTPPRGPSRWATRLASFAALPLYAVFLLLVLAPAGARADEGDAPGVEAQRLSHILGY